MDNINKYVLFFSTSCEHCRKLMEIIEKNGLESSFTKINIDFTDEISSIEWYRNDVLVSESFNYKDSISGLLSYSLKAKVEFMNGSYREREIWVNRLNTSNKIEDLSNIENQSSLTWDHKATIEINHNGEKYVSSPGSQSQQIVVTNAFDYGTNDNGQQVTFIEGSVNATFLKISTQDTVNGSFDIRFGIAH